MRVYIRFLGRADRNNKEMIVVGLIPRRTSDGLSTFHNEMDESLNCSFCQNPLPMTFEEEWNPFVGISQDENNFIVKVELPGFETKDVNISVSGDVLKIIGEKKKEEEEDKDKHHCFEGYYCFFQRSFKLPASVQAEKIEVSLERSILKIILPKTEEAKKQRDRNKSEIKTFVFPGLF